MCQWSSKALHHKCHYGLIILMILSFRWQCSWAYGMWGSKYEIIENPNIPCPGKNEPMSRRNCPHGGYIVNHNPENCPDRYICYVGLDEFCYPGDRCAYNAMCTMCGICQNASSANRLCPGIKGLNFDKRSMLTPLIEYSGE